MASSVYDDDSNHSSEDSDTSSTDSEIQKYGFCHPRSPKSKRNKTQPEGPKRNVVDRLINRQLYGKVVNNPRSKTEPLFNHIHHKCKLKLEDLIDDPRALNHVYMGFTICGKYLISYNEVLIDVSNIIPTVEYELYVWRFMPGKALIFISKHRIFKLLHGPGLDKIMFIQYPTDPFKIYCYGLGYRATNPGMAYLTILTLPIKDNCRFCNENVRQIDDSLSQGWCLTHGFMLHYMFTMSQPIPKFDPHISLSFPEHVVINTGHHIHILNTSCYKPPPQVIPLFPHMPNDEKTCNFTDNMSEVSETASDNFSANSIVEAILEDFSEYDLESNDCNKPFHELNISCEPLNVTGKSYHNALVQNIVDPRLKRLQSKECFFPASSSLAKPKIDRKIAEKAYEFTEENEKCEKLSSFRKKRLADKKYEFSEDNSENIVPFNSLRRERRYLYRSRLKSPEFSSGLFLSPRSPGVRSPMQSPNSRNGQFSPAGRNIYCPGLRNSPHHSKSPISPRESARKFNVYSPSMDSDCSDYDSKLILRQINNFTHSHFNDHKMQQPLGLLIVDSKKEESSKWIKKVVRRYSSVDFENSSLVSGQSRDDYNIPIEIPILVQTLTDHCLDIVPEFRADQITDMQLIVTQRSFDCEQFVQIRAQRLCTEQQLEFLHCEDYDIKLLYVCPLGGHIICQAVIKIGAMKLSEPRGAYPKPRLYVASCMFTWNIETDVFELIEPPEQFRLQLHTAGVAVDQIEIPRVDTRRILVMDFNYNATKVSFRDYNGHYEVGMDYERDQRDNFSDQSEYDFDSETMV